MSTPAKPVRYVFAAKPRPAPAVPNWAIGLTLVGFVAASYWYTLRAVGTEDLGKELEAEFARQRREQEARQL